MADKKEVSGYFFHKQWFEFAFNNPDLITPSHGAMMSWFIELNNKMDWREKFSSPASQTMAATGISSYNTYKKIFNNLVEWNFVRVISESKNQYTSCVIALSKFDKANMNDNELPCQNLTKQKECTVLSNDSIYKPVNNKPLNDKPLNKQKGDNAPGVDIEVNISVENNLLKKEKGSAEKEKMVPTDYSQLASPYDETLNAYVEMRKKIKKAPTAYALKLIEADLDLLSAGDESLKIEILQQSIKNSWQGVFPIKEQKNNSLNGPVRKIQSRDEKTNDLKQLRDASTAFLRTTGST